MNQVRVAVFASGTGSNFQAMLDAENLACDIVLLVSDKPNAPAINKAKAHGIATLVFDPKGFPSKQDYESMLIEKLRVKSIRWIFLAGYMRIVGLTLLKAFEGRIVNIHPSLLPAFPGKDAIGQAIEAGVKKTGVTIHFIDEGIDTGPIIAQEEVSIPPAVSKEGLAQRIHRVEHQLYPKVINQLIQSEG
ncbi:phosphoribosylglycinamide formyltransferase [Virgibacillus salexigens]|uniref:phosphoribosylglycinamide formyltransferase n=1 Tax=Virgibacillus salexigens TaxID=61016 RepID=UPI00190A1B2A|nr:phosphoribosylglycinamide formyltransferase [Virgibacillus salexigens]